LWHNHIIRQTPEVKKVGTFALSLDVDRKGFDLEAGGGEQLHSPIVEDPPKYFKT